MPFVLLTLGIIGCMAPVNVLASSGDGKEVLVETRKLSVKQEEKQVKEAKELLFRAPEATPLTIEGEEALKEHYVEKYMPVEGCSLIEELPATSDINYVPPKPKPKPKPVEKETPKAVEKKIEKAVEKQVETKKVEKTSEKKAEPTNEFAGYPISMTDDERYWLEKLVEAESAGESYEGKVAVASVIANRVEMKEFPNTVMGVIRAPKQFSPFMDGSIERRIPSEDSLRAVAQVFDEGNRNLPHDIGFFCTTEIAPHSWIGKTKPLYKVIGNHSFFLK
jgi:N-acetylmuramoyl-L-alanine amidase